MGEGSFGRNAIVTAATGSGLNQVASKVTGRDPGDLDPLGLFGHDRSAQDAAKAAQSAEDVKKANISTAIRQINGVYDSPDRQRQYGDFVNAVRGKYLQDAQRQKLVADLQTKFATARSGLTGGSRDVDAKRQLGEEFQQGILQAENKAQGALGDLKSADNQSRLNLIQLAQSGLDATTASSRALESVQAGTQGALANATTQGLGDIFAQTTKAYNAQQQAAALRQGRTAPIGSLYGKPI